MKIGAPNLVQFVAGYPCHGLAGLELLVRIHYEGAKVLEVLDSLEVSS